MTDNYNTPSDGTPNNDGDEGSMENDIETLSKLANDISYRINSMGFRGDVNPDHPEATFYMVHKPERRISVSCYDGKIEFMDMNVGGPPREMTPEEASDFIIGRIL